MGQRETRVLLKHDVRALDDYLGDVKRPGLYELPLGTPLSGRCYLVIAQPTVVAGILRKFPGEFVDHIEHGPCRLTREIPSFKLIDFDEENRVFAMAA